MNAIRDRIVRLERIPASALQAHPLNWRTHPLRQRQAWRGIAAELGFAGAVLARVLDDGSLQVIDGHLRVEESGDAPIPVLVTDLAEDEARRLLLTYDSLGTLAETDGERMRRLLAQEPALSRPLAELLAAAWPTDFPGDREAEPELDGWSCARVFQIVVDCKDEAQQVQVFEQLTKEGWRCRVLTL